MSTDTEDIFAEKVKPNEFFYSLKIWFTSASLGPIIFILFHYGLVSGVAFIFMFFFMSLYSLFFSSPCFALLYVAVTLVNRLKYNPVIKKSILVLAGIVLTIISFYLYAAHLGQYDKVMENGMIYYYLFATIAGIVYYKLHPIPDPPVKE